MNKIAVTVYKVLDLDKVFIDLIYIYLVYYLAIRGKQFIDVAKKTQFDDIAFLLLRYVANRSSHPQDLHAKLLQ